MISFMPTTRAEGPHGVMMHRACGEPNGIALAATNGFLYGSGQAFALDRGTMILKPVTLGKGVTLGVRSIVAPGATIPDGTAIGPLSSSYELQDAHKDNVDSCRPTFTAPNACLRYVWRCVAAGTAHGQHVFFTPVRRARPVLTARATGV